MPGSITINLLMCMCWQNNYQSAIATHTNVHMHTHILYRKRGKIRWAKLLLIPLNVVFQGKTFTMPYVYTLKQRDYMKLV